MLILTAYAQGAAGSGDMLGGLLFPVLLFVAMYFLLIRPQMKRAKEARALVEALSKGNEVVTAGGMVGRITKVGESYVTIEVARAGGEAVEVNVQKSAVTTLLPNGTIKAI